MTIKDEILKHRTDFTVVCQQHKVKYLYAFGSSTSDRFNKRSSDFDFLVELDVSDPVEHGEKLMSLWDSLENLFHRKVDLLTFSSIRNPVLKKSIDSSKVLVYEANGSKIFN